jgi:hypothetical protein
MPHLRFLSTNPIKSRYRRIFIYFRFYSTRGTLSRPSKMSSNNSASTSAQPDYTTWTSNQLIQRVLDLENRLREQINQYVPVPIYLYQEEKKID